MMKKIIVFVTLLLCSLGIWAQQTTVKTNFTIQKANPTLYLNGTAAVLDFYNGDVTFTQSSNLLTFAGGNLSLGSNSLLTTGSISATGSRVFKGWFTDIEITNLPTINGGTLATALSLSSYLLKTDTAAMLTPYIARGDTASMLTKYARKLSPTFTGTVTLPATTSIGLISSTEIGYLNNLSTNVEARLDSIVFTLSDTSNIETLLQIDFDTDTIADLSEVRLRLLKTDTAAMLSPYALTSELVGGDIALADSIDVFVTPTQLTDSLDVIRTDLNDTVSFDTEELSTVAVMLADSTAGSGHYASNYDLTTGLALKVNVADTASMLTKYITTVETAASYATKTSVHLHVDTVPIMVFGAGGGNAGDTAAFTTSTIYGSFYNAGSDSLRITELRVIMLGDATDTLSVDILWDGNLNDGTPTELNADPLPVNSFTTGDTDTSFGTAKIPPGVWVWCETPGVVAGRKPMYLNAQISGYKIPKY